MVGDWVMEGVGVTDGVFASVGDGVMVGVSVDVGLGVKVSVSVTDGVMVGDCVMVGVGVELARNAKRLFSAHPERTTAANINSPPRMKFVFTFFTRFIIHL